jgi:hypothetical protein
MIKDIIQFAIVTQDVDKTVQQMQEVLHLGPLKVWDFKPPSIFDTQIDGKNEPWSMKLAFGWIGAMQFEVIQPTGGDSLYQAFLDSRKKPGLQHLLLDRNNSYEAVKKELAKKGYPIYNEAKSNVAVQLGPLKIPPLPMWLAKSCATTFGYTNTLDSMKVVLEVSKYPPGVKPRQGIRMGVPSYWLGTDKKHFETLPENSVITAVTGFIVLVTNLEAVQPSYDAIFPTDQVSSDAKQLTYGMKYSSLRVVQPEPSTAYESILKQSGEGAQILQVTLRERDSAKLSTQGFKILEDTDGRLVFGHADLPFYMEAVQP